MNMWEAQNKRRPGAYVNFNAEPKKRPLIETEGIPAVMLAKKVWGKAGFIMVDLDTDFIKVFGQPLDTIVPVREALKVSKRVLVYLPETDGAAQATVTDGGLTVKAKHAGTVGNGLAVVVTKTTDGSVIYKTVLNNKVVDEQKVAAATLPEGNGYVVFEGAGLDANKTLTLAGGVDGTVKQSAVQDYLNGLDTQVFNVVAVGTDNESVKDLTLAKIKEWRSFGRGVVAVVNNFAKANHEAVISVANGLTLKDGTKLTPAEATAYVAAASANAGVGSLTYHVVDGAVDCERKTHNETVDLLDAGNVVFTYRKGKVVIEQDINTLTNLADNQSAEFSKNKAVRVMDIISTRLQDVFADSFIGKFVNDENGREVFKQQVILLVLDPLVQLRALTYNAEELTVVEGATKEAILVDLGVRLTDAFEKLYMTVTVQ